MIVKSLPVIPRSTSMMRFYKSDDDLRTIEMNKSAFHSTKRGVTLGIENMAGDRGKTAPVRAEEVYSDRR